jgi:prophage regulatory protein
MRDVESLKAYERVISAAERRLMIPYSDMHIWRLEKAGQFPQRIKIGEHRVGWALNEILDWIEAHKSRRGRS